MRKSEQTGNDEIEYLRPKSSKGASRARGDDDDDDDEGLRSSCMGNSFGERIEKRASLCNYCITELRPHSQLNVRMIGPVFMIGVEGGKGRQSTAAQAPPS